MKNLLSLINGTAVLMSAADLGGTGGGGVAEAIENAGADTDLEMVIVPIADRSDTMQFYADCITNLWEVAPEPATDDGGQAVLDEHDNPTWADCPDLDTLPDAEVESIFSASVKRAISTFFRPALSKDKATKDKASAYALDLFQDLAKIKLRGISDMLRQEKTTADTYRMVSDALVEAAEEFEEVLEKMAEAGRGIATTVAYGNHKSVTLKGGHNATQFFDKAFPAVRTSASADRQTALSMI